MTYVLLNPGPINVTERVRRALVDCGDMCHRESEYFDAQDEVLERLVGVFGLAAQAHQAVLLTGSGTAAVEAMIASFVPPDSTLVVLDNGVYGDRIARAAEAHRIAVESIKLPWGTPPDLDQVADVVKRTPRVGALAVVHHETTTGLLNPIEPLGEIAARAAIPLLVDGVSSLAGEVLDFVKVRPAAVACTANKCIQGLPGIAFVLCDRQVLSRMVAHPARSLYLHLPGYAQKQSHRDTPFTPAVQVLFALREALRELEEESVPLRIRRYAGYSAVVRSRAEAMGLELKVPLHYRSNTITSMGLPQGLDYDTIHDAMKKAGFVIYAGQGALRTEMFRIANMGAIAPADIERAMAVLKDIVVAARTPGAANAKDTR